MSAYAEWATGRLILADLALEYDAASKKILVGKAGTLKRPFLDKGEITGRSVPTGTAIRLSLIPGASALARGAKAVESRMAVTVDHDEVIACAELEADAIGRKDRAVLTVVWRDQSPLSENGEMVKILKTIDL